MKYDVYYDGEYVGTTEAANEQEACAFFGGEGIPSYTVFPTGINLSIDAGAHP